MEQGNKYDVVVSKENERKIKELIYGKENMETLEDKVTRINDNDTYTAHYLEKMQAEHTEWQDINFGPQPSVNMLMGVCEEVGELVESFYMSDKFDTETNEAISNLLACQIYLCRLMRARLKRIQGIRGTEEDHIKNEHNNLTSMYWVLNQLRLDVKLFNISPNELTMRGTPALFNYDIDTKDSIGDTMVYLTGFCTNMGLSLQECIEETWNKVKQRDWKADPLKGGE
jgi:NTP pyrophosphatase (non-canonical NTP hydrolase)